MANQLPNLPQVSNQRPHPKQGGVALITVLLITAILVGLTTQILSSHHLLINQHQNTFEGEQALQYVLGAEELARQALHDDAVNSGPGVDHLEELWMQPVLPFDLDGIGIMQAYIIDINGCFNVNTLADDSSQVNYKRLQRLLGTLQLPLSLADLVRDWVDPDLIPSGLGAEDSVYQLKDPAYLAANQPMLDLSELNLLADVDSAHVQLLAQHVCLLPETQSKINVNTADTMTLALLDAGISPQDAETITQQPRSYQTVVDFVQANPAFTAVQGDLSVTSEYFMLVAQAQLNRSRVSLRSTFRRDANSHQITLVQRDFAKPFRAQP
jgi:general secretion pathway protein K